MSNLDNLSDGIRDGFVLFYIKDKKLCSVLLSEEQAGIFNLSMKLVFDNKPARVVLSDTEVMKRYLGKDGGVDG